MDENNKMTSIARKINFDFWLRQFSNFLALDVILIIACCAGFFFWSESLLPGDAEAAARSFTGESYSQWRYVIETDAGKLYEYYIKDAIEVIRIPAVVVLAAQVLMLAEELFHTGRVRKLLRPFNDIAVKAEELSNIAFDSTGVHDFEQAVSGLDPQNPDARVSTEDVELKSLEIAINNLIDRMRESHRQQERFVSDASHELRTPIAVIQGYVNMLDRWGKKDEKILEESIEAIRNEADHMKNLIEQLLFLARGDSGRTTLQFEEIDLSSIVEDVWEESEMIDETHRYVYRGDESLKIMGDAARLKQSLRILVQNAAKYSAAGGTITLRACRIDGMPAYTVQDEGIGMDEQEVTQVFERFYRADTARTRNESGTGLGLSIAKWIIDAHRGKIEVLSRSELGSRFTVKFPALKDRGKGETS